MLYASLKALHLLCVVVWIGGMFFMNFCLRPAAAEVLEPPARLRLLQATMGRFFNIVIVAAVVLAATGATLIGIATREALRTGPAFNMPLDWYVMVGLFIVMLLLFAHIRLMLYRRLVRAVADQAWPAAATAIASIRGEILINLLIGIFIIAVVRLGGAV